MLGKKLEMVRETSVLIDAQHKDPEIDEGGIHLFKHAPRGIVFDCRGKRRKNARTMRTEF